LPLWALKDKVVLTPEGVGTPDQPHAVQKAIMEEQPGQCGFCLCGIMMTAVALVERKEPLSEREVRASLDKHLCRCGSHPRIVKAVMQSIHNRSAS
jgi:nicotinate dehydrogenase subunit A